TAPPARTLYRALLRELPPLTKRRTKLHHDLRAHFSPSSAPTTSAATTTTPSTTTTPGAAQQFLTYLRSQRTYVSLLERYNPGLNGEMDVAENVRLSARRVGLEL
ncbi:FMC1 protein family, partial [Geopyxis carbonaria]